MLLYVLYRISLLSCWLVTPCNKSQFKKLDFDGFHEMLLNVALKKLPVGVVKEIMAFDEIY